MPIVVIVVVVVVIAAVVVVLVRRREPDTLDSFQRQIDALSPEARRPVVDQVNQVAADDASDASDVEGVDDSTTIDDRATESGSDTAGPEERPDGT